MSVKPITKADVLELAKKLPYDERWELVEELEATLHPPPPEPPMTEDEFRAMIERRSAEIDSGLVKPIPWSEVRAKARAQLGLPADD
jgi:putative addiction module component (TIGR02574 family)